MSAKKIDVVEVQCNLILSRDDYNLLEATRANIGESHTDFYSKLIIGFCDIIRQQAESIKPTYLRPQ